MPHASPDSFKPYKGKSKFAYTFCFWRVRQVSNPIRESQNNRIQPLYPRPWRVSNPIRESQNRFTACYFSI